jgi:DNA (cytosine-5)-methyltransferase 1
MEMIQRILHRDVTFISLFAGGGGSSMGYKYAGFKEIMAFEWDKSAAKIFAANFPEVPIDKTDILSLKGEDILAALDLEKGEIDHLDASPPCQDFSRAKGKRDPNGERNRLYIKTLALIEVIQPKTFLIENVAGMLDKAMKSIWTKIVYYMSEMNYEIHFKVINATDFGVPQARRRLIMVGVRKDIAQQTNISKFFPDAVTDSKEMVVSKFLPYLMAVSSGQFLDQVKLASCYPSPTITKTASLMVYDGKTAARRKPSIDELKILSGFPTSYVLTGSYSAQFAAIGNAVPPPITYHIGCHLLEHVYGQSIDINGNIAA